VWAKSTNTLCYRKFLIAKRQAVWRLEHNGVSLIVIATKKRYSYSLCRHCYTMTAHYFFNYFFLKAVARFSNLVLARKQQAVCARNSVIIKTFMSSAQIRPPFKKGGTKF